MACTIRGRKMREEGRSVGYLLLQDGMPLILDVRDLYSEEIIKGLIENGYEYHDYYGDISTSEGVKIDDLPVLESAADDNYTFAGMFAQDALTEQQCLRYFKISAADTKEIEMHPPIEIRIHTREELLNYLSAFKTFGSLLNSFDTALPINAITARDALFTVEELEQDDKLKAYFGYMANRRRFSSMSRVRLLEDEFIAAGLMTEEQRGNQDALLLAYTSFGPEGLKDPVVSRVFERDVAYPITAPYTGTGREKNTFDVEVVRVRREGITNSILALKPDTVYALMDKKGNLIHNGNFYPRADVIGGTTRLFVSNKDSTEMKRLTKSADSWETQYQAIRCNYVRQINRVSMVLQLPGGQMYEWRCDLDNVALVSPTSAVYNEDFMLVMTADGRLDGIRDVYSRVDHDRRVVFRSLAKELLEQVKIQPLFENTVKLCEYCGLTAEQALDYVEYRNGNYGASELLHKELDPIFVNAFGEELLSLPDDAAVFDKLEALLSGYTNRSSLPNDDPNYFSYEDMMSDPFKLSSEDQELFFYIRNERPIERIEAILSMNGNYKKMHQGDGAVKDAKLEVISPVAEWLNTMFLSKYGSLYDSAGNIKSNELFEFITDVKAGNSNIASVGRVISYIGAEAEGCAEDFAILRYLQVKEAKMSAYVEGVVAEMSGDIIENRRHYAFVGHRLTHSGVIKRIIGDNEEIIESAVAGKFLSKGNERTALRLGVVQVLNMIWAMLLGSDQFVDAGEAFIYTIKYQAPESITMEVELKVTKSQVEEIKSGKLTAPFACTMEEWCRNSFNIYSDTLSVECVLVNAKVDPWYITPTNKSDSFKVYNGYINLAPSVTIEKLEKSRPEIYEEAKNGGGILKTNIREYYDRLALFGINPTTLAQRSVDEVIFKEVNKEEGHEEKGSSLPLSRKDCYLKDSQYESIKNYHARIGCEMALVRGTDRQVMSVPLKNDFYFHSIMPVYGYDFPLEVTTVPKTQSVRFLDPAGVYSTENMLKLTVKTNKVYPASFESTELIGLPEYLNAGFEPKLVYVISGSYIRLDGGELIDMNTVAESWLDSFADQGNALKIGSRRYLLVGINKRVVLEVIQ